MIYRVVKILTHFVIKQFFSDIKICGEERSESGPLLIVANHPNLALDSLVIGAAYKRDLWFMAKSTIFKNPILKRFFRACNMVPVYRKVDHLEGTDTPSNDNTFRIVAETLTKGHAVVIFPEGRSQGERKLSPIKTGAARIAFQAEESKNFQLGLKIQAVGLTYSELDQFRSRITLKIGKTIEVKEYNDIYGCDAIDAVRQLTLKIEEELRSVTVEIEELKNTELIEKITALYGSHLFETKNVQFEEPIIMQLAAENVALVSKKDPILAKNIEKKIDQYLTLANLFAVREDSLLTGQHSILQSLIQVPFVLLGVVLNYLPYKLVSWWINRSAYMPVCHASIKLGLGTLVFTLWYVFISLSLGLFSRDILLGLFTLVFIVWLSSYTNRNFDRVKLWALTYLWPGKKKPIEVLKMIRDQVISELDSLRIQ